MWRRLSSSPAARNAGASYLAFISTSLWGLLTIPVAVHYLEKSQIGLWAVVNTLLGYLLWMDLGIGNATGRLMADAVAKNDKDEMDRWWTAVRAVLWTQVLVVVILGAIFVPLIIDWIDVDSQLRGDAKLLLYAGIFITGFSFPIRGVTGLLIAQNRFHWTPLMQATVPWLNFGAFFICLKLGYGLKSYLVGLVVSQVATWILCYFFVKNAAYKPKWDKSGIKKARLLSMFKLSGNMAVVGLISAVVKGLPVLMLARVGGLAVVPIYQFSSRAPFLGSALVSRTYQSFYPGLMRLFVSEKKEDFQRKHLVVGRITLAGGLCGASLVLAINPFIVKLIASDDYFAGSMANMWFSVGLITFPIAGLYQILFPISGSMAKAAPFAVLKLILGVIFGILAWNELGLVGLAAVFALIPIVDVLYGWLGGVKSCGYSYREFSPQLLVQSFLASGLVILVGTYIANTEGAPLQFDFFAWEFELLNITGMLASGLLFLAGISWLIFSFRQLLKER